MAHSQPVADGAIFGGWFDVEDGRQILGDLALARADTRLYLHDREFFYVAGEKRRFLTGVLHDLRRVTLTGLNSISDLGSHHGRSGNFHYSELSPQQVLVGEEHIDPTVPSISKISFAIDDAFALFHDTDAFGLALDPRAAIRDVVQSTAELVGHGIATGENPLIAYFAGRRDIVSADTAIGRVSVDHYPLVHPFEGPSGAAIRNQILVQLDCTGPLPLSAALDHVMALLRFFELMGGRPQNLDQLRVAKSGAGRPAWLDVYWCRKPARSSDWQQEQVQPIEVLEDPIRHREQYEGLLRQWIATDYERMPARVRFSGGFQQQRHFPIDRLVGAANMFDILPKSAVPPPPSINADVQAARKAADAAFRSLPDSEDRQSVLGALKRIGTVTLRRKIEHRANLVSSALKKPPAASRRCGGRGGQVPELFRPRHPRKFRLFRTYGFDDFHGEGVGIPFCSV